MGTYPTVPSKILATGEMLADYIKNNPQLIGKAVLDRYGPEIPFLPKVHTVSRKTACMTLTNEYSDPILRQSPPTSNPP